MLASRKVSAWYQYVQLHEMLTRCEDLRTLADTAGRLIAAYIDNRAIWQELDYYRQHHTILGHHPAFEEFRRRNRLCRMKLSELVRRARQVEMNIWRVKSELAKGDKPHLEAERRARLAGYEAELEDIRSLMEGLGEVLQDYKEKKKEVTKR